MIRQFILLVVVLLTAQVAFAQTTFKITVKDETTKEADWGATVTVKDTEISAITDAQGVAQLSGIPDGEQTIVIFSPGYETKELRLTFPLTSSRNSGLYRESLTRSEK